MRRFAGAAALLFLLAVPAGAAGTADKQTLADIQADLQKVKAEVLSLKQEMQPTGASSLQSPTGSSAQARLDAIEAELSKLTAQTEALQNRINRVVADGTNRIGDLEFRLCELTEGCDPAALPETPVLGASAVPAAPAVPDSGTAEAGAAGAGTAGAADSGDLAVNEKADFDRAKAVLDSGDFRTAADLFETFAQTYTGGELTQAAQVLRGDALDRLGDVSNSARSYLAAFSGAPTGPYAGQALTKLGTQLGKLGQKPEACLTLQEVGKRFPGSADAANAQAAMASLGCS